MSFYYNDFDRARDANIIKDTLRDINHNILEAQRVPSSQTHASFKTKLTVFAFIILAGFIAMGLLFLWLLLK